MTETADDKAPLFDVTIVLKSGFSKTFRMAEFSYDDGFAKSMKWRGAPDNAQLVHCDITDVVMVFAAPAGTSQ